MNFDLSETQELFQSTAERFTRDVDVAAREKIRSLSDGYDKNRWNQLTELGLLAIIANDEQGGLGGNLADLSVIAETLGANNALDPWLENGALPIRILSIANHRDGLEAALNENKIVALAFSEPNSRYNLFPNASQATKNADNSYTLTGEKQFVMGGAIADKLLVSANERDTFRLFCIDRSNPALQQRTYRLADGSHASMVKFDQLQVPADAMLNLSYEQFQTAIAEIAVLCCAEMVGLSQLLLDDTVDYVKQREQFGVPIGSFQAIQHGLVDCYSGLEQMRSLLYRTLILETDSDSEWRGNVMGAKAFIAEGADLIARKAVQYHGAMGITDEVSIGHAMKRIIILARLFGDASNNLNQYLDIA